MSKKLTSTLLLFTIAIGFLGWGITKLLGDLSMTEKNPEEIIYSIMLIGCGLVALVALIRLPFKQQSERQQSEHS